MPTTTPSDTVPAVMAVKLVDPSTIKGSVKISTLVPVDNVWVFTISKPLFLIVIVGVLDPDLLVTLNDLIIKATALSLRLHPVINSQWSDNEITQHKHVHIGVAVAVEEGLVVPVLKFADNLNLNEIGLKVKDYASRAQEKKLLQNEIEGSTFTISNLGMFGIESFTSIINQPNSAILSVGSIVQKPAIKKDKIVISNTMKLTLACDHRTIDGASGSKFLQTLKDFIENPIKILL